MNLVKGDKDNLLGKVVIYAINGGIGSVGAEESQQQCSGVMGSNSNLVAWYCSTEPEEIAELSGIPLNKILEECDAMRQYRLRSYKGNAPENIVVLPNMAVNLDSLEDIMSSPYDVWNADTHPNQIYCEKFIRVGYDQYTLLLEEQVNKQKKTYKDIPRDRFEEYVIHNFVTGMIEARKSGQHRKFDEHEFDLFRFCERSEFEPVAVDLSTAVKNDPADIPFIYTHVYLMDWINKGRMGKALEYEHLIENMKLLKSRGSNRPSA